MIVVVGPVRTSGAGSLAEEIAAAAVTGGAPVQVVAAVPDGSDGDAALLRLARSGIGHAASIRRGETGAALDAADVELALRYLPDVRVVVLASAEPPLIDAIVAGAGWSDARLVVVLDHGGEVPAGLPGQAVILEAPARVASGFAAFVARVAVALERGDEPGAAVAAAEAALGAERVSRG